MKRTYVVAALAVFAAVAIATPVFGLSKSIKKAIKKEVAKQVKAGPAGPTGAAAPSGTVGAGVLTGNATLGAWGGADRWASPSGVTNPAPTTTPPVDLETNSPSVDTVAGNLSVRLDNQLTAVSGQKLTVELLAGPGGVLTATGVKCEVKTTTDGGDGYTCVSSVTATVPAISQMVMRISSVGTAPTLPLAISFGLQLTRP